MSAQAIRIGLGVPWSPPGQAEANVVGSVTRTPGETPGDLSLLLLALVSFALWLIMAVLELIKRGGRDIRRLVRQAAM